MANIRTALSDSERGDGEATSNSSCAVICPPHSPNGSKTINVPYYNSQNLMSVYNWVQFLQRDNTFRYNHRQLKLRTEDSHARVRELGSIRCFNVTSANVVRFLSKFVHIIIQVYGTMVANMVIVRFIFTILLSMTQCSPVIVHVLRGICSCVVRMFHRLLCNVWTFSCQHLDTYSYKHMKQR